MAVKHFDKVQSAIQTNQKRKRDREPSRIPVRKVLKLSKRKMSRHRVQNLLRKSVPNTSCITFLCSNYKYWNLWYNNEHYFGKYVFFLRNQKNKTARCKCHSCNRTYLLMSATKSEFFQSSTTSSTLKGGVLPDESNNVSGSLPWTILTDRLSHISLMPHDVGGSGDCFF